MILDAQTFELVLTPEAAIGIVGRNIAKLGWQKYEVAEIRLVYTPYWIFSFDVFPEGASPVSGKAALNAYTGELSDLVPVLLERPLTKTKSTAEMKVEVELTAISLNEVRDAAVMKIAAQAGVKRDAVAVSAISKIYVPFFRVWVNVANESYRADVDACLGSCTGLEAVPKREKTWREKSLFENIASIFKSVSTALSGGGGKGKGPLAWLLGTRTGRIVVLSVVIVVLIYFAFLSPRFVVECKGAVDLAKDNLVKDIYWLNGSCEFNNPTRTDEFAVVKVFTTEDGKEAGYSRVIAASVPAGKSKVEKFSVSWAAPAGAKRSYAFAWKIISS